MTFMLDPILASALARELDGLLRDTRVRGVLLEQEHREARVYTDTGVLVVRLGKGKAPVEVRILAAQDPPDSARKIALRISGVSAIPDERIVVVRMHRIRGHKAHYSLVVELRPSDANVCLAEGEDQIIRHILVRRESRGRRWRSGHPYPYPGPSERLGALVAPTAEEWRVALGDSVDPRLALLRGVAFTSPINAPWILEGGPSDEALQRWKDVVASTTGPNYLLPLPSGPQPYPHVLGYETPETVSLLDEFSQEGEAVDVGGIRRELLDRLERVRIQSEKRLATLERQLEMAPESGVIRGHGDLLLAKLHEVPRGVDEVELIDFEKNPVRLALDPSLTPHQNAAKFYEKAGKAERTHQRLPGLIEEARSQLAAWNRLHEAVEEGAITSDDLEEALPDPKSSKSKTGAPTYPYRTFRSSGGLEIRVGKGAKKNDDLTFRHSRPEDVWLHARHSAGAHVVLRWTHSDSPPARDLQEAAVLAAVYSKARTSGSVPVDWTRRKYVRKPRGARAGSVVLDRQETLFVAPDATLVERLAEADGS